MTKTLQGWRPWATAPKKHGEQVLAWFQKVKLDDDDNLTDEVIGGAMAQIERQGNGWTEPEWLAAHGSYFMEDWCFAEDPILWHPLPPEPTAAALSGRQAEPQCKRCGDDIYNCPHDVRYCAPDAPCDATLLSIINQYGIRHNTAELNDPARPYSIHVSLAGHGESTAYGATPIEAARRAHDWLARKVPPEMRGNAEGAVTLCRKRYEDGTCACVCGKCVYDVGRSRS